MKDGLGRSEGDDPPLHSTGTVSVVCNVGVQWRIDDTDPFAWPQVLESCWTVRCQRDLFPWWRPRIDAVRRVGIQQETFKSHGLLKDSHLLFNPRRYAERSAISFQPLDAASV